MGETPVLPVAQDSMHVGGGLKSALKEKGAIFWEMTAVGAFQHYRTDSESPPSKAKRLFSAFVAVKAA